MTVPTLSLVQFQMQLMKFITSVSNVHPHPHPRFTGVSFASLVSVNRIHQPITPNTHCCPPSCSTKPCSSAGSQIQHHTNRALAQAAKLSITQTVLWRRQPNSASRKPCSGAGSQIQHHANRAPAQAAKLSITQTVLRRRQPNSASRKPCSGAGSQTQHHANRALAQAANSASRKPCSGAGSQTQHHANRALAQAAKFSITQTVLWRRQPNSASRKPCSGAGSQTQHHANRALAQAAKLSITQTGTVLSTASSRQSNCACECILTNSDGPPQPACVTYFGTVHSRFFVVALYYH